MPRLMLWLDPSWLYNQPGWGLASRPSLVTLVLILILHPRPCRSWALPVCHMSSLTDRFPSPIHCLPSLARNLPSWSIGLRDPLLIVMLLVLVFVINWSSWSSPYRNVVGASLPFSPSKFWYEQLVGLATCWVEKCQHKIICGVWGGYT